VWVGNQESGFSIGGIGLEGADASGTPLLTSAFELPVKSPNFRRSVEQDVQERFHLERYRADYLIQHGKVPFEEVRRGDDPTDFTVKVEDGWNCLDCVSFAFQEQRNAYRLFEVLRRKLLDGASGRTFGGIRNCVVIVAFGDLTELPPRRRDDTIVEPLLDAFETCSVDGLPVEEAATRAATRGLGMPMVGQSQTPGGEAAFVANFVPPGSLGGEVFERFGFDVHLQMQIQLSETDVRSKIEDVVKGHDKPEIEHLLVTAGGPDQEGLRYPSEELAARFLIDCGPPKLAPVHLQKVTLHLWDAGEVVPLHPSRGSESQ
jgi:hypothetical protein